MTFSNAIIAAAACALAGLTTSVLADTATVDFNTTYQRIDGFGVSSAYSGTVWTDSQADLLFSTDVGLGLSLLRVKITADVTGTGAATKMITSPAETAIAKKAIARGARVWSSPWSPPAQFKTTGNTIGGSFVSANNQAYADMLADYAASMKTAGVDLYAISVQNEPDWSPTSYEGCGWSAQQMHDFIPFLYDSLNAKGAGTTRILAPESLHWEAGTSLAYINAIMNDPNTAKKIGIIADHNYDGIDSLHGATNTPADLPHDGRALWETEVMTSETTLDPSIANGMYWAKRLHLFMTAAQANGWNFWWVVPYPDGNSGLLGVNWDMTKRAYVLGQFARFVRPGFYRIGASTAGAALISAYKDPTSGKFAIVAINPGATDITEAFTLSHFQADSVTPWLTSPTADLAQQAPIAVSGGSFVTTLPASSVTTFVGTDTTPKLPVTSSRLLNLSIRSTAGTADATLIAGFVVAGGDKQLLVRAAGPVLTGFGVAGALAHPQLQLVKQGSTEEIATNAGWDTGSAADTELIRNTTAALTFPFPAGSADSAIVKTLPDGAYSAKILGLNGATGVALAEVYDANVGTGGRLINASARTTVGTKDDVLIAGFVITGNEPKTVLIRAVGPTLASFGVGGTLPDPKLELLQHLNDADVPVASNTGWGSTNAADIVGASASVGAFPLANDSFDSALLITLQPGQYSAEVTGASGDTGVALVEIYEVR